jgi:hypothetical protein
MPGVEGLRRHRLAFVSTLALVTVAARAVVRRGGAVRLASLLAHRLDGNGARHEPEESRLYARGRRRWEAHLARRRDGRRAVVALPLDGTRGSAVYAVDESEPWGDFERQAGLVGAPWGPCLSVTAGL